MTDKPIKHLNSGHFAEKPEKLPLTPSEIEGYLAIVNDDQAEIPLNKLDAKLQEMLMHPEKSLEPAGPLAGPARSRSWIVDEE